MAGEWLKFESNLPEKPEVLAITALMGWDDPDLTVGKLMRLFRWFDQHTTDGNASGVTSALLDRVIGVTGFVQAVQKAGWVVVSDDGIALNHFDYHNGASAKTRAQTAKRVGKHRASEPSNAEGNAPTVTTALAREEKRREENLPTPDGVGGNEAEASPPIDDGMPQCPHREIIAAFHAALPGARHVREWTPARASLLRTRWREKRNRQRIEWWVEFFAYVAKSPFLTGQVASNGRKPFELGLEWLLKAENFAKVIEGAFHEEETA